MSRRTSRLGEEIREEVARMIATEVKDPRIGFVTVTRVDVTADLRTARVHVGVLGTKKQRDESLVGLNKAAGFLRRALGQRLRLRHTPELAFQYDAGLDAADRVAVLLAEAQGAAKSEDAGDRGAEEPTGQASRPDAAGRPGQIENGQDLDDADDDEGDDEGADDDDGGDDGGDDGDDPKRG